jgi:ABC-type branched-subunit amino acid transport system ATPase component
MSVLVNARAITSGYQGVPVLRDVSISVAEGEFVLLAGPNGAGKSTLCMTLSGALPLMGGDIEIAGEGTTVPMYQRARDGVGILPERRSIFNDLTVEENLLLGRGRVDRALEYFPELSKRRKVKAGLLSGGEQQMLALGRVLAATPRIVLMDELSLGLAPIVVDRLMNALDDAVADGAGVLLIEQHVRVALEHCHRAYFINRGQITFEGPGSELASDRARLRELYL